MNKLLISAAMLATAYASSATAHDGATSPGKIRCYGVAEAGKNDCHSTDGVNLCAGSSTRDNNKHDWKFATLKECKQSGGSLTAPAKDKK